MSWRLEIHHLDVGQGDSTLILVKNNNVIQKSVLIDGGPLSAGPSVARYVGEKCDNKPIDIIILSHYHADHSDGLGQLLGWPKYNCNHPPTLKFAPTEKMIQYQKKEYTFKKCEPHKELLTLSNKNIKMTCIAGNRDLKNPNLNSLGFLIQFYNFRYYTGGDLEGKQEEKTAQELSATLTPVHAFKAGHHGSKISARDKFLNIMQPNAAIISCGYNDDGGEQAWSSHQGCNQQIA